MHRLILAALLLVCAPAMAQTPAVDSITLRSGAHIIGMPGTDVVGALGYTPMNPSNNLSEVNPTLARVSLGIGAVAPIGTTAGTVAAGNDPRLVGAAQAASFGSVAGLNLGANLTSSSGNLSLSGVNVTTALGYTPINPANNLSDVANIATVRINLGVIPVGTTAGTVAAGNDSRIVGAAQTSTLGNVAGMNIGTTVGTVAAGNDGRIVGAAQTATLGNIAGLNLGANLTSGSGSLSLSGSNVTAALGVVLLAGVCDGTADDSAAFNAAMAALPANGGTILIPGTVSGCVLGGISIAKQINVRGLGGPNGKATILAANATSVVFDVAAQFTSFEELAFSPRASVVKQTAGSYIKVESSAARFAARKIDMKEFYEGITLGATSTVDLENIRAYLYSNTAPISSAAIHFTGNVLDARVTTCSIFGWGPSASVAGIAVDAAGDITISNCDIGSMGTDVKIAPGTGQSVSSLTLTHSLLDTAVLGMDLCPTGSGSITRVRVIGSWASSMTTDGMRICPGVDGVEIVSHQGLLNGGSALNITGGKNIQISGGMFSANSGNAFNVAAGVSNWSITGATIGSNSGYLGNGGYGISVAAGASDNYRIVGNNMNGNVTGAIYDLGTGTNKSVFSNPGDANDCEIFRENSTGQLIFNCRQTTFSGFIFKVNDGTTVMSVTNGGLLSVGSLSLITPLSIASGGTSATTAAAARVALGVAGFGSPSLTVSTIYTVSGAIAVSDNMALVNCASACAMTLGAGATDGKQVVVKHYGAGTVTLTANIDGTAGTAISMAATTAPKESASLTWYAAGLTWIRN